MHTYLASPEAAVATPVRERDRRRRRPTPGISTTSSRTSTRGKTRINRWTSRSSPTPAVRARWPTAPAALLEALQASDTLGQLAYKVYYYCSLRYDEDTRNNDANAPPSARAGAAREVASGHVVVQSGTAGDSARHDAQVVRRSARARRLPLRARGALSPAGTRARRKGRAPAVAVGAVRHVARRHLRGAVDGRHEVSRPSR